MIGPRAGVAQDTPAAAGVREATPHRFGELGRADIVGAGGEKQDTAGRGQRRSEACELAIAANCGRHFLARFCEGRRVGDDDVETLSGGGEPEIGRASCRERVCLAV